jgi:hypothetical protein
MEHVEFLSYCNGSKAFVVFGDSLIVILKYSEHDLVCPPHARLPSASVACLETSVMLPHNIDHAKHIA